MLIIDTLSLSSLHRFGGTSLFQQACKGHLEPHRLRLCRTQFSVIAIGQEAI